MQFEELYNTYYNKVLRYFSTHTDSIHDAEDLATSVFMKCYEKFDSYFEENGTAYIVMEYLKGETLKQLIQTHGPVDAARITGLMLPLIKSLQRVHEQGLIHRDISPDNIMLVPDGMLKLFDFGAARDYSGGERSYSIMLKPGFAPQEQYRSRGQQGPWTDIYALCATMYYCVTGKVPDDSMQRVFQDELKSPSELGVEIPAHIDAAIMKGLLIKEEERFRSANELYEALSLNSDTNVVRISTQPQNNFQSEAAGKSDGGRRTVIMPEGSDTSHTTVMAEAADEISRTGRMESNEPRHTELMSSEQAAVKHTVVVKKEEKNGETEESPSSQKSQENKEITQEKQKPSSEKSESTPKKLKLTSDKTKPLPKKQPDDKEPRKRIPTAAKVLMGVGAGLCVLIIAVVMMVADMFSGETRIVLTDKTVSVEEINKLVGKQTRYIEITDCVLEDGVLRAIGKKDMPDLSDFSLEECSGDRNYAAIDFSKYKQLRFVTITGCDGAGDIFAGSGEIDELTQLEVSGAGIELSILDKLKEVFILSISTDNFDTIGDRISGVNKINNLMLKGYSTKPEITAEQITGIFKDKSYEMLRLENLTLSEEAQEQAGTELSAESELKLLSVSGCGLKTMHIASECTKLETLIADGNEITNLDQLEKLIYLKKISFNDNRINDLSGLSNCTQLQKVLLRNNQLTNSEILDKSARTLQAVDLSGNTALNGSLGDTKSWINLAALNISDTGTYSNTLELYGSKLVSLIAPECGLSSIKFIYAPEMMRYIDISGNALSNASMFNDLGKKSGP